MWLTLAAFLLLLFTGCFYAFGSCCIPTGGGSSGRRRSRGDRDRDIENGYQNSLKRKSEDLRNDEFRMAAVRAEADRQAAEAESLSHAARAATGYTPYQDPYQHHQPQQPSNTSYLHTQYSNDSGFIGQHQPYSDHPTGPSSHGRGEAAEYYSGGSSYTAAPPPGPAGYDGPPGYDGNGYSGGYRKIN
jgi:hypothetical protein